MFYKYILKGRLRRALASLVDSPVSVCHLLNYISYRHIIFTEYNRNLPAEKKEPENLYIRNKVKWKG